MGESFDLDDVNAPQTYGTGGLFWLKTWIS